MNLKDGLPNGQGAVTFVSGNKYVGTFKDNLYHGQGTFTFASGSKYVGQWQNDERNGQGTYTWANGDKYVGQYLSNVEVKGIFYWKEGGQISCQSKADCKAKWGAKYANKN